jgi:quinoprotein glucose dehydrogenase
MAPKFPRSVQGTKRGSLFVFNRLTRRPVFPIVEKPVPQSDVQATRAEVVQQIISSRR